MTTTIAKQDTTAPFCSSELVERILIATIQQLDRKINLIARPPSFSSSDLSSIPIETKYPVEESDQDFYKYEYYRRKKYLLSHIQSLLTPNNAGIIQRILEDNYLCEFDDEEQDTNMIRRIDLR